jgi:hypothetical protein
MLTYMSRIVTIQGRQLAPSDIEAICQLIADNPNWHRTRLSKELCQLWRWRTETGLLKDMACRSMLRKLEQKGFVALPVARHSGNRKRRILDVPHDCDPIDTDLCSIRPIQLVQIQGRGATDDLFHCLMDRYHYLGCKGHVGEHMKYIAFDRTNRPVACLLFGSAAWKIISRDQLVGWDKTTRLKNLRLITNNTRFLILPWVRIPHLASFILGASLRRLRQDWIAKYGHKLCLVETFVDRSRFAGTCYRAANWIKIGQSKGRSRQDRNHKLQVPIKDIYVYPLASDYKQQLCEQH